MFFYFLIISHSHSTCQLMYKKVKFVKLFLMNNYPNTYSITSMHYIMHYSSALYVYLREILMKIFANI